MAATNLKKWVSSILNRKFLIKIINIYLAKGNSIGIKMIRTIGNEQEFGSYLYGISGLMDATVVVTNN